MLATFRRFDGVKTQLIAIMHATQFDLTEVEIDELGWFTSDKLPSPLHSQFWKSYQIALDAGIVK